MSNDATTPELLVPSVDHAVIAVHRNHIAAKENPVCRRSAHYADYATAWAPAFAPLTPYL